MDVGVGGMTYTITGGANVVSAGGECHLGDREAASAAGHVSAEAPDRLVPVHAGLGHAVRAAAEGQHVPQLGGQSALLRGDDGGHDHVEAVDLLQHGPRHAGHLAHVLPCHVVRMRKYRRMYYLYHYV